MTAVTLDAFPDSWLAFFHISALLQWRKFLRTKMFRYFSLSGNVFADLEKKKATKIEKLEPANIKAPSKLIRILLKPHIYTTERGHGCISGFTGFMWTWGRFVLKIGSFSNEDGDGNKNVKTAVGLVKHQVCRCVRLFSTFLCRCCTITTWRCPISRFMEDVNLSSVPKKSTPGAFAYIRHFQWIGIKATKFEKR